MGIVSKIADDFSDRGQEPPRITFSVKSKTSKLHDITVNLHGKLEDAVVEYEPEYERADPSVGIMRSSMNATVIRVVLVGDGRIVTDQLDKKELERIADRCAEAATDEMENDAERRQAALEDAWDAKRKGE